MVQLTKTEELIYQVSEVLLFNAKCLFVWWC